MCRMRRFIVVGAATIAGIAGMSGVSMTTVHAATTTQAAPMMSPAWGGGGWDNRGGRCDWGCDRGGRDRDRGGDNRGRCGDWDRDGRCRNWR